jgi:hypothetical protein
MLNLVFEKERRRALNPIRQELRQDNECSRKEQFKFTQMAREPKSLIFEIQPRREGLR